MIHDPLTICLDKKTQNEFFDEILVGRFTKISFNRTLRIPENGRDYPLPAGLGRFPIHRVEDYADKVPVKWLEEGGFFIPLYQREAMFLQFEGPSWHPTIAKVSVGKVNAITGKTLSEGITSPKQDYIVIPNQKWLDGINFSQGVVKQFVAMPLGKGYTIEAQITDEEKFGGFQITVADCIPGFFPERDPEIDKRIENARLEKQRERERIKSGIPATISIRSANFVLNSRAVSPASIMGIAAGGNIKQQIEKDTYGIESWSSEIKRSITIHIVNSKTYEAITGFKPPDSPITIDQYQRFRIPWYSYCNESVPSLKPLEFFKRILGVDEIDKKRGIINNDDSFKRSIKIDNILKIRTPDKASVENDFRNKALKSKSEEQWHKALREISYAIDISSIVRAEDYVLRSCCNYCLSNFKEANIDSTLALDIDHKCIEARIWRFYCRSSLKDYEGALEDARMLSSIPAIEQVGRILEAISNMNQMFYGENSIPEKVESAPTIQKIINEASNLLLKGDN